LTVTVIGAGLAGCEAAWQAASLGVPVTLVEMKPEKYSPAHHSPDFAELVCSNSLRADRLENAVGLLKEEMRRLHSLILEAADATRVPAGGALAVDRQAFSALITRRIRSHPNITVVPREAERIPDEGICVVASGPLTAGALADDIASRCGQTLHFFDAAAPIVEFDSIDLTRAFFAARYGRGGDDYINCPMNREEYEAFYRELLHAQTAQLKDFDGKELKVFEGCMPVEVMAARGADTLRYGPLKPVGLRDPRTGREPYAVVQLRRDNAAGSLYNIVGFQTHLKFPEQERVFSMIPGLENARFVRYGVMHRNTFLDSPRLLDRFYRLRREPRLFFAGQMTGVEGYVESASSGLLAGLNAARAAKGLEPLDFTARTAIGALARYVSAENPHFQPMNVNFGIIEPPAERIRKKQEKYALLARRALETVGAVAAAGGLETLPAQG
jgi:methylenetetrahydrofolate--tRNA-(uracil-5-)-methyltransferase